MTNFNIQPEIGYKNTAVNRRIMPAELLSLHGVLPFSKPTILNRGLIVKICRRRSNVVQYATVHNALTAILPCKCMLMQI
jgi:hypothetical protein